MNSEYLVKNNTNKLIDQYFEFCNSQICVSYKILSMNNQVGWIVITTSFYSKWNADSRTSVEIPKKLLSSWDRLRQIFELTFCNKNDGLIVPMWNYIALTEIIMLWMKLKKGPLKSDIQEIHTRIHIYEKIRNRKRSNNLKYWFKKKYFISIKM